jgi:hypothetical protein
MDLHKIPKIFLFDAAKFPSFYKTTKNGNLFEASVLSVRTKIFTWLYLLIANKKPIMIFGTTVHPLNVFPIMLRVGEGKGVVV